MVKSKSVAAKLSEEELDYYSRQVVMADMGYNAQLKLKNSRACLVGVGGLGSPAAKQLAAMGVGHLRIVDRDVVELTNLHRQNLYGVDDVGYPKVEAAAKRLRNLNPYITVEPLPLSVTVSNAEELVRGMDVVVDGLDSMKARYAINRACIKLGVPYVFGAAITTTGNVSTIVPGETACLECFYGSLDDKKLPKCGVVGVHPSLVNIIASLEVSEAIRILTGKQPRLVNKLLNFDLDELEFNEINLQKVDRCPVCGSQPSGFSRSLEHELVEEICGRKGKKVFVIVPEENLDINLLDLKNHLTKKGFHLDVEGKLGVTFVFQDVKVNVMKSGVTILEGIKEKDEALKLFSELTGC
ncbi:MAG: 4-methyl-5(B-hydroxyethyl)-thiazole monophosphate biosynthesis protein [Candidatus Bathyarchaeum sp.]|nr:MAG: 4-methyl-5(B-hydroxyethyl)-thiazole monophosphate biosynthesis protein [Candidatus Bathyarchaeum sp.]